MPPAVVLLGPPGCGKGTQASRLRATRGFVPLSTGELLRDARRNGTELGRRAAAHMDRGDLVPDDVIVDMMREAIDRHDGRPLLFDGFPRTVAQADALQRDLEDRGRQLDAAVLIDVPDDEVVNRIAHRGQGREDDTPETARERLRVYHGQTEPLVSYYDERGLLRRVDGAGTPDDVERAVTAALD